MTVRSVTVTDVGQNAKLAAWSGLTTGDTGEPLELPEFGDRTVTFEGTFGGATIILEGSNDGTTYTTLTDPQGNAISKLAAGNEAVTETPRYVRPSVSGGAGVSLQCRILARRGSR